MGLADAETLTLPARPRESRRVSSFATTPCPNNPRLIPAPLSMSPHNTHYGQEGRVRVEWGGVPDGPSTRRKGRCRILLSFPRCRLLLPAAPVTHQPPVLPRASSLRPGPGAFACGREVRLGPVAHGLLLRVLGRLSRGVE